MLNATPPKSCSYGKQKNKEIALANNLFLAFPAGIEPTVYRLGGDCVIRLRYGKILTFWKLLNGTKIIKFIPIFIPIWFFMLTKHNIWCIFALLYTIFSDIWRIKCFLRRAPLYPFNYEQILLNFYHFDPIKYLFLFRLLFQKIGSFFLFRFKMPFTHFWNSLSIRLCQFYPFFGVLVCINSASC